MFTVITAPSVLPVLGLALPTVHLRNGSKRFEAKNDGFVQIKSRRVQLVGKQWQACALGQGNAQALHQLAEQHWRGRPGLFCGRALACPGPAWHARQRQTRLASTSQETAQSRSNLTNSLVEQF
jgi:hypothetical protein